MEEKLASIEVRYNELTAQMADPAVASDYARYAELARQQNELREIVEKYRAWRKLTSELPQRTESSTRKKTPIPCSTRVGKTR